MELADTEGTIYLIGVSTGSLASAEGTEGGTFDGVTIESGGGWQLFNLQTEVSCGPVPCPV